MQKKRHAAIKDSISKISTLLNKPVEVNVKQVQDTENSNMQYSDTSTGNGQNSAERDETQAGDNPLNSKTPSHPEFGTVGVDASTGMLGEGFATAVGIALGEKILEERFNKKPKNVFDKKTRKIIDYHTYVLASDGDLMEGISYEAASFAGNLKLGKLIVLYDANKSSMDTNTNKNFTESISSRFMSQGWHVQIVKNGKSISEINKAIEKAKKKYY